MCAGICGPDLRLVHAHSCAEYMLFSILYVEVFYYNIFIYCLNFIVQALKWAAHTSAEVCNHNLYIVVHNTKKSGNFHQFRVSLAG